jgi:hypothetical protein
VDPSTVKKQSEIFLNRIQANDFIPSTAVNSKKGKNRRSRRSSSRKRVDWLQRDEFLNVEVERTIQKIKTMDEPIRVNIASIARYISAGDLAIKLQKQSLDKLPMTKKLIKSSIETTEAYQIRRLVWGAEKLKGAGLVPGWRVLKVAGLNHPLRKIVSEKYNALIIK